MLKTFEGSETVRARKKRKKATVHVSRKPARLAQMIRRRSLLTGGSVTLSTSGPAGGLAATARVTPLLTAPVGVEVVLDAPVPGATRAAAGVEAGAHLPGTSPVGAASATVPDEAAFA